MTVVVDAMDAVDATATVRSMATDIRRQTHGDSCECGGGGAVALVAGGGCRGVTRMHDAKSCCGGWLRRFVAKQCCLCFVCFVCLPVL